MSALTPEKKKEMLLMVIDGLRKKVEDHIIGDTSIDMEEKITPIHEIGKAEPVGIISEGFCYKIDVRYLDPKEEQA